MILLVQTGEGPNTRIGSLRTKHSHIDHKCEATAPKCSSIGRSEGHIDANICGARKRLSISRLLDFELT